MYTLIEYMPLHLRESHRAARNSGVYPHNGAVRVWVEGDLSICEADYLDTEWASVVRTQAMRPEVVEDDIPGEAMGGIEF